VICSGKQPASSTSSSDATSLILHAVKPSSRQQGTTISATVLTATRIISHWSVMDNVWRVSRPVVFIVQHHHQITGYDRLPATTVDDRQKLHFVSSSLIFSTFNYWHFTELSPGGMLQHLRFISRCFADCTYCIELEELSILTFDKY